MQALVLFLAALLSAAALHKLLARARLVAVTARLTGTGLSTGALLLALAATAEALAALALVVPPLRTGGALAAAGLWLVYGAALSRRHGMTLDCGCDLVAREKPVDALLIARPAVLAVLALGVALAPPSPWTLDAPFAALALLALWFAAGELHSIPRLERTRP